MSYTHLTISTNGVRLHVVEAGPADGPLVILLHGFPEFWYGWRKQIDALAAAGYRVWAPDQRGYNLSDKPAGVASYSLDQLAADVIGLLDAALQEKAVVIGHDWGAAVAWWTACAYPERLHRLVILNVPHHKVFRKTLAKDVSQRLKSGYMAFFQLPALPEALIRFTNYEAFARALTSTSRPGAFTPEDIAEYRQAWGQPGAVTSMLNWYRAVVQRPPAVTPPSRVTVPTLMLWGKQDHVLKWQMAEESIQLCEEGELVYFEKATHWIQHDEPERVNARLLEFLARQG